MSDWSLRKQISEPSCKEFSLNVKVLSTESSYLSDRVMMLYCCIIMLYYSVVLLYFLYGGSDREFYWESDCD